MTVTCPFDGKQVCSLDVNDAGTRLVTGAVDREMRMWALSIDNLEPLAALRQRNDNDDVTTSPDFEVATPMGSIQRESGEKCDRVRFFSGGSGSSSPLLGCQASGKVVELFRVRNAPEAQKRLKRRLRRRREKARLLQKQRGDADADADADGEEGSLVAVDELESVGVLRSTHKIRSFSFCTPSQHGRGVDAAGNSDSGAERARVVLALHNNALEMHSISSAAATVAGGARVESESLRDRREKSEKNADGQNDLDADEEDAEGESAPAPAPALAASEPTAQAEVRRLVTLEMPGHRTGVRAVAISSSDKLAASTSSTSLKIWNVATRNCVRSIASGYGTCVMFLPGDHHILVGTREGALKLFELASTEPLAVVEDAHTGTLWAMDVQSDGRVVATGGADHDVKFWSVEMRQDEQRLGLTHTRTLRMADDVLAVRYSGRARSSASSFEAASSSTASRRLFAVATLDATVKVFHEDTLKFSLSLYGHKLPVLSLDMTDDSMLIATGSADKTVKLWGLDFGDCHRSLLAHDDSVTAVRFVPGTHYVFTASKDKTIKYWDADRFEQVRPGRSGAIGWHGWHGGVTRLEGRGSSGMDRSEIRDAMEPSHPLHPHHSSRFSQPLLAMMRRFSSLKLTWLKCGRWPSHKMAASCSVLGTTDRCASGSGQMIW